MARRGYISRDPKFFWGPHYWFILHSAAAAYNPKRSGAREGFKELVNSYLKILPCEECKVHLRGNLKKLPLDPYLQSADQLFLWTYNLHDLVNRQLGKTSVSFNRVKLYYFTGIGLECKGCQL